VNLLKNGIGIDQALTSMLKGHPTLKSLCGNTGDETELDMSGKMSGAEDAIMLAAEIVDNGMLSKLDVRSNCISQQGKNALQQAWNAAGKTYVRGLSLSSYCITHSCLSALHTGIFAVFSSSDACVRLKTAEQMKRCIVLYPIVDCDNYR
jgi:hypothetical protein